jgi:two-component system response regulator YesN
MCKDNFACTIACYETEPVKFEQLPEAYKKSLNIAKQNVVKKSKLFLLQQGIGEKVKYISPDLNRWKYLLDEGYYDITKKEVYSFLDMQMKHGNINMSFLKKFHHDFVYLFFNTVNKNQLKTSNIFSKENESDYDYEAIMNSYMTLNHIKNLVDFVINYLKSQNKSEDVGQSRIDDIVNYLHKNIQKNVTRKDIAEEVYLNPEYLSRLFKKEKGVTLSEFILEEKMNIAKHLLETTNFSVSIVASKVGYTNFSHFAQSFKKLYSISPSEYRKTAIK